MAAKKRPPNLKIEAPTKKSSFAISSNGAFQEEDLVIGPDGLVINCPAHRVRKERSLSRTSSCSKPNITIKELNELVDLNEILGQGSSGVVRKMKHIPSDVIVAVKSIPLADGDEEMRRKILNELKTMDIANHEGIVNFLGAFYSDGYVKIVMEYMDAGTLKDIIKAGHPIPESILSRIAKDCLQAVVYIHKDLHIVHRDIKPSNLLVNSRGAVKLSDFGVVGFLDSTIGLVHTFTGTVTYMSPERIKGNCHSSNADIWSLGISLLECRLGWYPYTPPKNKIIHVGETTASANLNKEYTRAANNSKTGNKEVEEEITFFALLEKIEREEPPLPPPSLCSDAFRDFIDQCLQKDPGKRPSAAELLEHEFITSYDNTEIDVGRWMRSTLRSMGKIPKKRKKDKKKHNENK